MRSYLAIAWICLGIAFVGTVFITAFAGGMIVVADCPRHVYQPHPDDFVCSNGGVSDRFVVGTSVLSVTIMIGAAIASVVFGVIALRRRDPYRWPQPVAFLITLGVALAAAVLAGMVVAEQWSDATTASSAALMGIIAAGLVGGAAALIIGVILALAAHLTTRRLARSAT